MDEETLEAYVRALRKSAEYLNKEINPIELAALIRRFKKLNPEADPKAIDWVGVWDPTLTYSELIESFQRNYPMYKWREEEVSEEAFKAMRKKKVEEVAEVIRELDEEALRELFELLKKELELEAEIKPEALPEKETVVQEVKVPTLVQEAPTITLGVLSRYPILPETKQFFETFAVKELEGYAEATKLRITEALQETLKGGISPKGPPPSLTGDLCVPPNIPQIIISFFAPHRGLPGSLPRGLLWGLGGGGCRSGPPCGGKPVVLLPRRPRGIGMSQETERPSDVLEFRWRIDERKYRLDKEGPGDSEGGRRRG